MKLYIKKLLSLITLISLVLSGVFADNFTNKFKTNALNINKETDTSLEMDLDIPSKITSFSISGVCKLSDNYRSFFRAVLVDKDGYEYLVAEYIGYLEDNKNINFKNLCFETIALNNVKADKLKIILNHASVHINAIEYSTENSKLLKQAIKQNRKLQHKAIADKYNKHNKVANQMWVADTATASASLSYMEKKNMSGCGDYFMTDGLEYYCGGLFVMKGDEERPQIQPVASVSNYAPNFTWTNRHGRNWNTPVKSQIVPANPDGNGGCWAFAPVAVAESYINLYYNQKIDPDLSEQQIISCSGEGNIKTGGFTRGAAEYILAEGLVEEKCFPFTNTNGNCGDMCYDPKQIFVPERLSNTIPLIEDSIKHNIINNGPLISSVYNHWYNHAMSLVGYGRVEAGMTLSNMPDGGPSYDVTIPSESPLIGRTYWIFKNSYGTTNSDGYLYVIFDDFSMLNHVYGYFSGISCFGDYSDDDIICEDLDGDGFYNWGIGPKPAHCPECPDERDANDCNPYIGGMTNTGMESHYLPTTEHPTLSGPSNITCDASYVILGLKGYENIVWSIKDNSTSTIGLVRLKQVTNQGLPVAVFRQGESVLSNNVYTGPATIVATITKANGTQIVLEKDVTVDGSQKPYVDTNFAMPRLNTTYTFKAHHCDQTQATKIRWKIQTPTHGEINKVGRTITYKFTETGTFKIIVENWDSCDRDPKFEFSVSVYEPKVSISYNNPANGSLILAVEDEELEIGDQYTAEIWHDKYGKMKTVKSEVKNFDINTDQLASGYYTVKFFKNNEMIESFVILIN